MTALRCGGGGGDKPHALIASTGDVAHCLNAGGMGRQDYETETMVAHATIAIQERAVSENPTAGPDGAGFRADNVAYTLEARTIPQAVAFDLNQITSKTNRSQPDPEVHHTLPAATCPPHLAEAWAVRRLMPVETARLQGFPDDHTAITYRGKPAADGPQYKAHGNSMAVPVIRWIMERMHISMTGQAPQTAAHGQVTLFR